MFKMKPYSSYVLVAIAAIKKHIDNDPFQYMTAAELLDHLCTPHRNSVEKAFKDVYGCRIKEYQVKQRLYVAKKYLLEGLSKNSSGQMLLWIFQCIQHCFQERVWHTANQVAKDNKDLSGCITVTSSSKR